MPKDPKPTRETGRPGRIKLAQIERRVAEDKLKHLRNSTCYRHQAAAELRKLVVKLEERIDYYATKIPGPQSDMESRIVRAVYGTPALLHERMYEITEGFASYLAYFTSPISDYERDSIAPNFVRQLNTPKK